MGLTSFMFPGCNAVEKMTRNSNALKRDVSVMPDSDVVDFLSGSTDLAINFSRSADLHTHIHPPQNKNPNWQEADQLAMYKCSRGVAPGTTSNKSS